MPRVAKGAYLYLDPSRKTWSIRDARKTIRTRQPEAAIEKANAALEKYATRKRKRLNRAIYFVTCDMEEFPIKIGMSGDLDERMRDIRTSLPFPVLLLGSFMGTSTDETAIHRRFSHLKIRGEWFRRSAELMQFIEPFRGGICTVAEPILTQHINLQAQTSEDWSEWQDLNLRPPRPER